MHSTCQPRCFPSQTAHNSRLGLLILRTEGCLPDSCRIVLSACTVPAGRPLPATHSLCPGHNSYMVPLSGQLKHKAWNGVLVLLASSVSKCSWTHSKLLLHTRCCISCPGHSVLQSSTVPLCTSPDCRYWVPYGRKALVSRSSPVIGFQLQLAHRELLSVLFYGIHDLLTAQTPDPGQRLQAGHRVGHALDASPDFLLLCNAPVPVELPTVTDRAGPRKFDDVE